jgi:hypothetical protein
MLIINSYESYNSAEFIQYCKDYKIIPVCMPLHLLHLLQLLNIGYFAPLKKVYRDKVNKLIRN